MFDSQKLSFESFLTGYRHGIYVFTDDACHICEDYKESISYINNANLYFVEVATEHEKNALEEILERSVLPLTACFKDNKLKYVKAGQLFDKQLEPIISDLNEFGDKPLTADEIQERLKKEQTKCNLAFYMFTNTVDADTRKKIMSVSIKYNELPIDVDSVAPDLPLESQEHLFEGQMPFAKIVLFKDGKSNIFSNLSTKLVIDATAIKGEAMKLEIRNISDILG
jgi:hypothetical protein